MSSQVIVCMYVQCILINPSQFVLKNIAGLMSLADHPNQFAVFCNNSCTKWMSDKRVKWMKRWRINESSLYLYLDIRMYLDVRMYLCAYVQPS